MVKIKVKEGSIPLKDDIEFVNQVDAVDWEHGKGLHIGHDDQDSEDESCIEVDGKVVGDDKDCQRAKKANRSTQSSFDWSKYTHHSQAAELLFSQLINVVLWGELPTVYFYIFYPLNHFSWQLDPFILYFCQIFKNSSIDLRKEVGYWYQEEDDSHCCYSKRADSLYSQEDGSCSENNEGEEKEQVQYSFIEGR